MDCFGIYSNPALCARARLSAGGAAQHCASGPTYQPPPSRLSSWPRGMAVQHWLGAVRRSGGTPPLFPLSLSALACRVAPPHQPSPTSACRYKTAAPPRAVPHFFPPPSLFFPSRMSTPTPPLTPLPTSGDRRTLAHAGLCPNYAAICLCQWAPPQASILLDWPHHSSPLILPVPPSHLLVDDLIPVSYIPVTLPGASPRLPRCSPATPCHRQGTATPLACTPPCRRACGSCTVTAPWARPARVPPRRHMGHFPRWTGPAGQDPRGISAGHVWQAAASRWL
jgi:hypothetical protein